MANYTIYADEDDNTEEYNSSSQSSQALNWAAAREGTGTVTVGSQAILATPQCSRTSSIGAGTFLVRQWFAHFDTAAVAGSIVSCALSIMISSSSGTGSSYEVRERQWAAQPGAFVPGSQLAALTQFSAGPHVYTTAGRKTITKTALELPRISNYGLMIHDQAQRTNTQPTSSTNTTSLRQASNTGTSDDPYLSITTTDVVAGSVTAVERSDTAAAAAVSPIKAATTATERADTASATGRAPVRGTAAATERADTATGAGAAPVKGEATATERKDTIVADATAPAPGSASAYMVERRDTAAATGVSIISGTATAQERRDTSTGQAATVLRGSVSAVERPDTATGTGTATVRGTASAIEARDTAVGTGAALVRGTASATEARDTLTSVGRAIVRTTAVVSVTERRDTSLIFGAGTVRLGESSTAATATPERIRRIRREAEFARFSDAGVLATYPRAQDGFENIRESFFDNTADAQVLINELATALAVPRRHEAAELSNLVKLGDEIPLTPSIPKVRMVDKLSGLEREMPIKGFSIDFQTDRNSIEAIG